MSKKRQKEQKCIEFDNGGKYEYNPHISEGKAFMNRLRFAAIRKFGPHLKTIGLFNIVRPKEQHLKSQCIGLPKDERVTAMMVYGHSKQQNPHLIVTSWPIDFTKAEYKNAKNCNDICEKEETYDCACHDPLDDTGDAVTYQIGEMELMYSKHKYFSSMHSVIDFKKFNLFNQEFEQVGRQPSLYTFELPANGQMNEHISLDAQYDDSMEHNDHDLVLNVHLKVTSPFHLNVSTKNMEIKMTLSGMNKRLGKSKSCIIERLHDECSFLSNAHFAHYISIDNNGEHNQQLTLRMNTNENKFVPRFHDNWKDRQQHLKMVQMKRRDAVHSLIGFACIGTALLFCLVVVICHRKKVKEQIKYWRLRLFSNASMTAADEDEWTDELNISYATPEISDFAEDVVQV